MNPKTPPAAAPSATPAEPIAIIGIGCRYPGGIHDLESFWQVVRDGVDAISEIPPGRFDPATYCDPNPGAPGKVVTRQGGFLSEALDQFDAAFFGISPREAGMLDPQQRLLLEVAWEALEDAGLTLPQLAGSRTGVYVGMWTNEYQDHSFAAPAEIDLYATTGSGRYAASGRISYAFDLQGPSLTVDTACSSSLVAIHLACQSLRQGETELALVGAANLILQPHISIGYSRSKMLSPDARCKFGDAAANGYVRSEGVGLLVLKPLARALADGNPIHAVILGSATNNDGRGSGLLVAPSREGQAAMIRAAYHAAHVVPGQVGYIEAHGTGTQAGDPVELQALSDVLREGRAPDLRCAVGSVKTNIGHTEAASGLAGMIKAVLCLKHRVIPPNLHFDQPNPRIPWAELPLFIPRQLGPWPGAAPAGGLIAGVNSFGITGTNAHVILQAAPAPPPPAPAGRAGAATLPLSAHSPAALQALAGRYAQWLAGAADDLTDLLYTASQHRTHHEVRLAVSADTRPALAQALQAYAEKDPQAPVSSGRAPAARRVVFVFPGQGSQWPGMGRRLFQLDATFRGAIQRCAAAFGPYVDWSLLDQFDPEKDPPPLTEIDQVQPSLFALEVALAETWRAWGVEPAAVVGHSMGEPAAAYIAGALSLEDAARVICTRSRLMKRVSGLGAMAVTDLTLEQANAALSGYAGQLSVAVHNGPRATVLSGDPAALAAVSAQLEARGVFVRPVKVDVAAHSPHMDALRPLLVAELAGIRPQLPAIPLYSTVTGGRADFAPDADYWGQNLRQPVLFAGAVDQLSADGHTLFIECSPHPILLAAIEQNNPGGSGAASHLTLASMRRGDEDPLQTLRHGLEQVYCQGGPVLWQRLYPAGRCVRLPAYPWQREHFWLSAAQSGAPAAAPAQRLLQTHFETPDQPGAQIWQGHISLETFAYLADHRVAEAVLLPAAAFLEMLFETAPAGAPFPGVRSFEILQPLPLQPGAGQVVQVIRYPNHSFLIASRAEAGAPAEWVEHARGFFLPQAEMAPPPAAAPAAAPPDLAGSEHVAAMRSRGLNYGPAFQAVERYATTGAELEAQLHLPAGLAAGDYCLHPVLLDAALQLLIGSLDAAEAAGDAFLPVKLARCQGFARAEGQTALHARVTRTSAGAADRLVGDIRLNDAQGRCLFMLEGLELRRFDSHPARVAELVFGIQWQAAPVLPNPGPPAGEWLIVSADPAQPYAAALQAQLGAARCASPAAPEAYPLAEPLRGVIFVAAAANPDEAAAAPQHSQHLLRLAQALGQKEWHSPPRLWVVTQGAQAVQPGESAAPGPATLWGLAAALAHEFPEWNCTRIDLDRFSPATLAGLLRELAAGQTDPVALRGEQRFGAQLVRQPLPEPAAPPAQAALAAAGQPFRLEVTQPGVPDSLELRASARPQPAPGQVLIEVQAAGLNFIDVLKSLGVYPGLDPKAPALLGLECAGTVVALGADLGPAAPALRLGQAVLAFAAPSLGRYVLANAHLVQPKPAGLSFAQAAALPVVYLTAYYALCHLGRMAPGERVLIHSAAGGVGLAAIQLAKQVGAEVFATAGSEEKRAYLRALGVPHVMDSRSLDFAAQVLESTGGRGVDLVLNSLTGEAISHSLGILAPYGRFLEIGKRDIYENARMGLLPFQKNLSYFAIDLDRMARERPEFLGELFAQLMRLFEQSAIEALPITVFPLSQMQAALRRMAQPNHTGKIVIDLSQAAAVEILPQRQVSGLIQPQAAYLITGGLGALGLAAAGWLAQQGARHLALVGRSGAEHLSPAAQSTLQALQAQGVELTLLAADLADAGQAAALMAHLRQHLPPLRGVLHAAGLLEDGGLLQQTPDRFARVFAPKVAGAWNLHRLTQHQPLDFFVLFSSVTSVLGSPGQANYAAANAFLDALAHYRQSLGLPGLSINWGPWGQIGLAAQRRQGGLQGLSGLRAIPPETGLAILGRLLEFEGPQVLVARLDAAEWRAAHPAAGRSSLFAALSAASPRPAAAPTHTLRANLLAAPLGRPRLALLESYVQEQAAQVLRLPPARIELQKPLRTLGMDSLMAIEFRNRLESGLEVTLSATLVWNYPTVNDLAPLLAEKMGIPLTAAAQPAAPAPQPAPAQSSAELKDLSDEELTALLGDELDAIDDLL